MKITEKLPRGLTIGSFVAIFMVLGLLPFIAWLLEYKDTINAPLTITTKVTPVDVYARTSGELRLLVRNDSLVAKNADLAVIRNTATYEAIQLLKNKLAAKGKKTLEIAKDLSASQELQLGELKPALVEVNRRVANYLAFLGTDRHRDLIASREKQIGQYGKYKKLLAERTKLWEKEKGVEEKRIKRLNQLYEEGIVAEQELEDAIRRTLVQDLANLESKTDSSAIALNIQTLEREKVEIASQYNNQQRNFTNAIKEALQLLEQGIANWELKYLLKANIAGRCIFKDHFNDYLYVRADEKVFSLIPSKASPYFALLQLPIQGAGKVKRNQEVYVKLNNYPFMEFGVLKGRITNISELPFDDHYNVQVKFPRELITTYGDTLKPQPLMQGIGEVVVERKSLYGRISEQVKSARLNRI